MANGNETKLTSTSKDGVENFNGFQDHTRSTETTDLKLSCYADLRLVAKLFGRDRRLSFSKNFIIDDSLRICSLGGKR